jgi:hypothetical protein
MIYFFVGLVCLVIIIAIYFRISIFFDNIKEVKEKNKKLTAELKNSKSEFENLKASSTSVLRGKQKELEFQESAFLKLAERNEELENAMNEKDTYFDSLKNKTNEKISKITSLYADHLLVQYDLSAKYLENKKHPAKTEAKRIKELKKDSKIYLKQFREMLYKYEILLQLFPELVSYVEDFSTIQLLENIDSLKELEEDFDRVNFYVNQHEYQNLSENQRNQLALNRYLKGQKTNWQIGRDYELYCGREYELDSWNVEYIGMEKKLNDMGRDLIAQKNNEIHIIQCKYWAKHKEIHEKHITQLYGTTIAYGLDKDQFYNVVPVFITNIKLSSTARKFADKLGVLIIEKELNNFPRIKCNVGKDEFGYETKIYHLPFDQQYDRTKIDNSESFYAVLVDEATKKGFRRAYRYYGG